MTTTDTSISLFRLTKNVVHLNMASFLAVSMPTTSVNILSILLLLIILQSGANFDGIKIINTNCSVSSPAISFLQLLCHHFVQGTLCLLYSEIKIPANIRSNAVNNTAAVTNSSVNDLLILLAL